MKLIRFAIILLLLVGCSQPLDQAKTLTLATTTSTRDSGLLDMLLPIFEKETGIEVKVIAVGSGQALELGRRGDADVLMTHAPAAEQEFMDQDYGEERRSLMYNDFVLVGPKEDPAQLQGETSILEAFRQIARTESLFVSRGDESGTHMKEELLWNAADVKPEGDWYVQAGAGMAEALRMASQKRAYTLSDRATFLAQRNGLNLTITLENDPPLMNPYSVIIVSSKLHPHVRRKAARQFADFLLSPAIQKKISEFGIKQYEQPLFFIGELK